MKNLPLECRLCHEPLTEENWYATHRKVGRRQCKKCYKEESKARYAANIESSRAKGRQRNRRNYKPHARPKSEPTPTAIRSDITKGALAFDEQNQYCAKCKKFGIATLLTVDNWMLSFRRRRVRRCSECHYKLTKAYDKANPEKARAKVRRWTQRNPDYGPRYRRENRDKIAEKSRRELWKAKRAAFQKLGGKCRRCGCTDIRALQVNHVNGGGTKEKLHGGDMYRAIVCGKRNTRDLECLCANCNLIWEYERGTRRLPEGIEPDLSVYQEETDCG